MRFGTWKIRSLYRSGSTARDLARYKFNLLVVQEVRWDKGGMVRATEYIFSMEKETKIINWEQDFLVHHRLVSAVKKVEFVSDRLSYIVLRGRWCNIFLGGKTHNHLDHILMDRRWDSSILDVQSFRGADCDTDHYLVVAEVWETLVVIKQAAEKFDVERFNLRKLKARK